MVGLHCILVATISQENTLLLTRTGQAVVSFPREPKLLYVGEKNNAEGIRTEPNTEEGGGMNGPATPYGRRETMVSGNEYSTSLSVLHATSPYFTVSYTGVGDTQKCGIPILNFLSGYCFGSGWGRSADKRHTAIVQST
jgi:hypothetical protein